MEEKKIVVTGALGMLGKVLVRELVRTNSAKVISLIDVLPQESFKEFLTELGGISVTVAYSQIDILDEHLLRSVLSECNTIFHLAGIVSYSKELEAKMNEVNVEGTRLLVALAQEMGVRKIVYASSISAVSLLPGREATEEDYPPQDASYLTLYSQSKIKAEEVFFAEKRKNLIMIAANIGVIIGRSKQFESVVNGIRKSPLLPMLQTYNSYIDARDAARGLVFLSQWGKNNERYILTAFNVTNGDFVNEIAKELGKKALGLPIPRVILVFLHSCIQVLLSKLLSTDVWKSMAENKRFSIEKIKKLGWSPKYSLEESIKYLIST